MVSLADQEDFNYGSEDASANFSLEDRAILIEAVTDQTSELIDWLSISANVFGNKYSPRQCIFEFLKLPISQSLALNIESSDPKVKNDSARNGTGIVNNTMDKSRAFLDEYPAKGTMTVFNDAGNPLLS